MTAPSPHCPKGRCRPGILLISRRPKEEGGVEAKVEKCKTSPFIPRQDEGAGFLLEKGMAALSRILAWRKDSQRSLVGYSP